MKKKDPPKRKDEMPDVIRAVPSKRFIFTDRTKTGISQEDAELVAFLAEIQEQKAQAKGNPKELKALEIEEQEIEQHFRRKEFKDSDSFIILEHEAKRRMYKELIIAEDRKTDPFKVMGDSFTVSPHALRTMDSLLAGPDSEGWIQGIRYLIDFMICRNEAEEGARFADYSSSAVAHMRAWAGRVVDSADSAARAVLIEAYSGPDSPAIIYVDELRKDLKLLGPEAEERIVGMIRAIRDPGRLKLERIENNDLKADQRNGDGMAEEKKFYTKEQVVEFLRSTATDFDKLEKLLEIPVDKLFATTSTTGVVYSEKKDRDSIILASNLRSGSPLPDASIAVFTMGYIESASQTYFFFCDPTKRIILLEPLLYLGSGSWDIVAETMEKVLATKNEADGKKEKYNFVVGISGLVSTR